MAATLSQRLGMVDGAFVARLTALIAHAGLPVRGPDLSRTPGADRSPGNADHYLSHMRVDKKAEDGEIRFVLIDGPGRATVRSAPDVMVREVIDACCS